METIDWITQGVAGSLCAFLLIEWWRDHERVSKLARYMLVPFVVIALLLFSAWVGRMSGVNDQLQADSARVEQEWRIRQQSMPKALGKANIIDDKIIGIAVGEAKIDRVNDRIISGRSYIFMFGLWSVLLFVAGVPAPARRKADEHAKHNADDNDS